MLSATAPSGFLSLHTKSPRRPRGRGGDSSSDTQHTSISPRARRMSATHLQRKQRRLTVNKSKLSATTPAYLKSSIRDPSDHRTLETQTEETADTTTIITTTTTTTPTPHQILFGHVEHHPLVDHFSQQTRDLLSQVRLRTQSRRDGVVQWEPRRLGVNYAHIVDKYRKRREEIRDETRVRKDVSRKITRGFDQHRWLVNHGHKVRQQKNQAHLKRLRQWWDFLDADGGGTLSVDELEDPLVSVGLARGRADVEKLIEIHDTGGEGELTFENFMSMLTARGDTAIAVGDDGSAKGAGGSGVGGVGGATSGTMSATSPNRKEQEAAATAAVAAAKLKKEQGQKKKKKRSEKNAVMQLFDDLEDGKFGDKDVGLPLQITTFRRQMLLNVHLSPDPEARAKGLMVLNGIIDTKRSQRKDLELAAAEEEFESA